jgi:hypothetical protein
MLLSIQTIVGFCTMLVDAHTLLPSAVLTYSALYRLRMRNFLEAGHTHLKQSYLHLNCPRKTYHHA